MLLPRILAPTRAIIIPSSSSATASLRAFDALRAANGAISSPSLSFVRHATHQAQGRANGAKDGPGKRLGAKKSGGEYVIPGNIIFRQRGTAWFPGENCKMGRDHCIYAVESGYVRYYRDPLKHPKRQYIGVVFDKHETLPHPPNAARRRRLNMLAVERDIQPEVDAEVVIGDALSDTSSSNVRMSKGYAYREANWSIGRSADRAKVEVKKFVPGDRFAAWRKSKARIQANVEKSKLRNAQKSSRKSKTKR